MNKVGTIQPACGCIIDLTGESAAHTIKIACLVSCSNNNNNNTTAQLIHQSVILKAILVITY